MAIPGNSETTWDLATGNTPGQALYISLQKASKWTEASILPVVTWKGATSINLDFLRQIPALIGRN
ncbi:hypothetical protein AEAC466_21335 [Asticcacaulis sp. AC466]|nr:hypothetical protein AEAC466_21335 [Asticcacaulis sp. AC466]